MPPFRALIAVLPCHDLDASEAFYNRLGFTGSLSDPEQTLVRVGRRSRFPDSDASNDNG